MFFLHIYCEITVRLKNLSVKITNLFLGDCTTRNRISILWLIERNRLNPISDSGEWYMIDTLVIQ